MPAVDFETWWKQYPKKAARKAAEKAWKKINPNDELARDIWEGLLAMMATAQWRKAMQDPEMPYIPHAATFLNQERWTEGLARETQSQPSSRGIDPEVESLCDRYGVDRYSMMQWLMGARLDDGRLIVPDDTCYGWVAKHYGPLFGLPVTRR